MEFGVYKGSTYCWQAQQILRKYHNSSLIGFDSWQGLPVETGGVWIPERHAPREFKAGKIEVLEKLKEIGVKANDGRFRLVDGFFKDSLTDKLRHEIHDVIFINVDVDIHRSTIELLDFVRPLLRPGVVIYWDDWKDPKDENDEAWGEHLAWSQWYPKQDGLRVETIEVNPVNQRSMLVTRVGTERLSSPSISHIRYRALDLSTEIEPFGESDRDYHGLFRMKKWLRTIPFVKSVAQIISVLKR